MVFNLLCLGDLKRSKKITRISSGPKLMTMIWFHPRARTIVQFASPPTTSALSQLCGCSRGEVLEWQVRRLQTIQKQGERKEYFTERSSSWENQVTLITPKGNHEKGFLTSTQYCREVKDGISQPTGNSSCVVWIGLTHLHIFGLQHNARNMEDAE